MRQEFSAGATRWATLRSTLMGPDGIVATLEASVRFGMVIYSGGMDPQCVSLVTVDPALNNYATLDAMYPMEPIGTGTPTDKALDHVFTSIPVLNMPMQGAMQGAAPEPVYVVLATDGAPNDNCSGGGGAANVEQRVIDVTMRGTQMGANVFIISLAGDDTRLQTHLEAVAQVTASRQPPFVPATKAELIAAVGTVVATGTCQVTLNGSVDAARACRGQVLLSGQPLACDSDDGWRLTGSNTLQLTGTACQTFLSGQSQVHATFPCGVFVPD